MNNAPRKKLTLKQRVVITIALVLVALPVSLIIYTLSGALPWWYYFTGKRLAQTWPDNEVAILVAGVENNYIYWPQSRKSYTFSKALKTDTRQQTAIRAKNEIWVNIRHSNKEFIVTDKKMKSGIWKDVDGPSTSIAIKNHKIYTLSPSAVELLPWPVDNHISGNWICINGRYGDGRTVTTVYKFDVKHRHLYKEFQDSYGWFSGNSLLLVSGDGSITRIDLGTWKRHDTGSLGMKRDARSFVASGQILINGSTVYRYEGNSVKKISVIRPRYGEIGAMFNEVSIVDDFIIHKYLYNLTYMAGFDVYRVGSSDLVAATVKGVDNSYAISNDDAKIMTNIDQHGLKNAQYIP